MLEWIIAIWLIFGFFIICSIGLIILLAPLILSVLFFWFLFKLIGGDK